jgi:beta-barrel assembly-enhancing protease
MRLSAFRLWIPLVTAVLLTRCSCDFFGATGALFISEDDEMRLGRQFDSTLANTDSGKVQFPIYAPKSADSQKVVAYVADLAQEILRGIPEDDRPGYDFKITLIDQDVVNAFAVPGGYVYIYTGIIKNMKDESELSCVLGHEIAHVTQHHYRDALAKEAGLSFLVQVLLGKDAGQLAQLVGQTLGSLASLKVSRSNESEADYYGTRFAGTIGRNPLGVAKFFGRMPEQGLASWVSTHPAPEDRVEDVRDEVGKSPSLKALAEDSLTTNYTSRFLEATAALRK